MSIIIKKKEAKICFINNFRFQQTRKCHHDLQSSRNKLVLAFANNRINVDVYGAKWEELLKQSPFLSKMGTTCRKLNVLRNYDFIITFENTKYKGYITEKPYHAIYTGTIPIYTCGDKEEILDYLDEDIFIEAGFNTPEEIVEKVCSISQNDIFDMRLRMANWLEKVLKLELIN